MSAESFSKEMMGAVGDSSVGTTATDVRQVLRRRRLAVRKDTADAMASTASTLGVMYFDVAANVIDVRFVPDAALTANDTNYATLTAQKRDGAGGAGSTIGSQTTKITGGSGNWTAHVPVALTPSAPVAMAAGNVLTLDIAKTAAGVVVPAGYVEVIYEEA